MPPHSSQPGPGTLAEVVSLVLDAYRQGVFPMADPEHHPGELLWYDPDPRGIIPILPGDEAGGFRVSASLRQRVRSGRFRVTTDAAFDAVVARCSRRDRPADVEAGGGVWIDSTMAGLYAALHAAGNAHSVEVWRRGDDGAHVLVGGLFGVTLHGLFAGESMFSLPEFGGTDASKVALVHLVAHLRRRGFRLLDTQFITPHLQRFGAVEISREAYRARLEDAMGVAPTWQPWEGAASDIVEN